MKKIRKSLFVLPIGLVLAACGADESPGDVVWAINVAGGEYRAIDGTEYLAESSVSGGRSGTMETVKGSQDAPLYKEYRVGDISVTHALPNGVYDVTFHFAEPDDVSGGDRVFDVIVEGRTVIEGVDVMLWRDGKTHSALTVTVPGIVVSDGELNVEFEASVGEPVLSALVVRPRQHRGDQWQLVWQDEFEGSGPPDEKTWNIDRWPARVVNDEDQAYTDAPANLRLENGYLVIEARKEPAEEAGYTSARIHTQGKADILYGRVEVRAMLPRGQGTWPAIWMLPSDPFRYATKCEEGDTWQGSAECDAWPNSGEIDIMEHVGYQMGHVHGTVHNEAYYWAKWEQRKGRVILDDVDEAFHDYVLEWTPERIDVFIDDTLYFTYANEKSGWRTWPYDEPFHLILNVAVGGMWGRAGGPIDDSAFPQRMLVDYVRVYEAADPR